MLDMQQQLQDENQALSSRMLDMQRQLQGQPRMMAHYAEHGSSAEESPIRGTPELERREEDSPTSSEHASRPRRSPALPETRGAEETW